MANLGQGSNENLGNRDGPQDGPEHRSPTNRVRSCFSMCSSMLHPEPETKEKFRTCTWYIFAVIFFILTVDFLAQLVCLLWKGSIESCRNRWMPANLVEPVAVGLLLLLLVGSVKWTFKHYINDMWSDHGPAASA
jgi:hypothetical protein